MTEVLSKAEIDSHAKKLKIALGHTESQRIRNLLIDELARNGFDKDYAPNESGAMMENLIDRFFVA